MRSQRMTHPATRPHPAAAHRHWRLAESIQMSASDRIDQQCLGIIAARRHATGWFIAARYRAGIADDHLDTFREFVTVRVQALLSEGPHQAGWTRGPHDEWLNHSMTALVAADVRATPDTVPAHWG